MQWRDYFTAAQRALPRDATPQMRARATQRAAAAYRAGKNLPTRSNPPGGGMVKLALMAGAAYVALQMMGRSQSPTPPAATPPAGSTGR